MLEEVAKASDEVELIPRAGFVVKTKLSVATASPKREKGTKVFLNICSDDNVPLPEVAYDAQVIYPLIMDNKWEIPIVTSEYRVDKDKKGALAYVYDCIINTKAMRWVQMDKELREILIEWSLESAELRSDITLSREDIAVPKMTSKGEPQNIKLLRSEMDLNKLNKEFEAKISKLENDPMSILEAKRFEDDETMKEADSIDIFNINKEDDSSQTPSTKPLIQEIEKMTISNKSTKPTDIKPKDTKKPIQKVDKPLLKYETTMHKVDVNGYKLKIEIKSQNDSSLDYDLEIARSSNTLILKNTNPKFTTKKDLELPLPTVFENPQIKSFFVHSTTTLVIFVK